MFNLYGASRDFQGRSNKHDMRTIWDQQSGAL